MKAEPGGESGRAEPQRWLRLACFLTAAFAWLLWLVDPSLTYYGAGMTSLPAFSPDPLFLLDHLGRLGGLAEYAAAWLSQLLAYPALGALVLTALAGGTMVAADTVARQIAGRSISGLRYAPGLAFLAADARYLHLLDWQLGWLAAFASAALWLRLPDRPTLRWGTGLAGLVALYYLAGGAVLVAALVLALGEPRPGRAWPAMVLGLTALLPWLSTRYGFDRPIAQAYRELALPALRNDVTGANAMALSLLLPAFALLLAACSQQARISTPRAAPRPVAAWAGLAAALAFLWPSTDHVQRLQLRLAAHAARGEWTEVLEAAERLPVPLRYIDGYAVLRALAETGQSGEVMFRYPLQPYSLMRSADPRLGPVPGQAHYRAACALQLGTLELDLGFINEAEAEAHEAIELLGAYPRLLVPMARIQVLKQRPEAARVFLRLAAAQPATRQARALLAALRHAPTLDADPEQRRLRRVALTTDTYRVDTTTGQLEALVAEHPENRLATEYLFAWYLLTHRLDRLVAALPSLPRHGRAELPRHYQEAVVCWEAMTGRTAKLGPWRVTDATRARFQEFRRSLGCDPDELARLLSSSAGRPPFGAAGWQGPGCDTYYAYRLFGISGEAR